METDGVISKITKPTEWVTSMVVTEKKSCKLRKCLDLPNLDKLLITHYQVPTLEVIRSSVLFSSLDANSGFVSTLWIRRVQICCFLIRILEGENSIGYRFLLCGTKKLS